MENEESKLEVGIGAEAIKKLLSEINTVELAEEIRTELANGVTSVQRKGKLIKRLRLLDRILRAYTRLRSNQDAAFPI